MLQRAVEVLNGLSINPVDEDRLWIELFEAPKDRERLHKELSAQRACPSINPPKPTLKPAKKEPNDQQKEMA